MMSMFRSERARPNWVSPLAHPVPPWLYKRKMLYLSL
jgi:hypothetical protein